MPDLSHAELRAHILAQYTPQANGIVLSRVMAASGLSVENVLGRDAPITVGQQLVCARNAAAIPRRSSWYFEGAEAIGEYFYGPRTSALLGTPTRGICPRVLSLGCGGNAW
jgi:hypothetical protein